MDTQDDAQADWTAAPAGDHLDPADTHSAAHSHQGRKGYTALFHIHGMGSQRRYEEISRIVDALDQWSRQPENKDAGQLTLIQAQVEPSRSKIPGYIGYINVTHRPSAPGGSARRRKFRFYEGYWAYVTAEGAPYTEVLWWLVRCATAPIKALRTPWRLRARLRRACLLKYWEPISAKAIKVAGPARKNDLKAMLEHYDRFENWDERHKHPGGTFKDFLAYLESKIQDRADDPQRLKRFKIMARQWHFFYILSEWRNLFLLSTVLLAAALSAMGIVGLIYLVLKAVGLFLLAHNFTSKDTPDFIGDLKAAVAMLPAVLSAIGITRFLKDYLGDVLYWTTYEETSDKFQKRKEIMDCIGETLIHVLDDPLCERVVLSSHSLGTTIAFDTLLELARRNRAGDAERKLPIPLDKVRHLITFGSPIDKVHYFFESYAGKYHRYNRVVENLRGDIGSPPFAFLKGWPHIHWINFWDRADVISSRLYSPANSAEPSLYVNNVQVSNVIFPDPAAAHTGYFENQRVVETLFLATFYNAYAYPPMPPPPPPQGIIIPGHAVSTSVTPT